MCYFVQLVKWIQNWEKKSGFACAGISEFFLGCMHCLVVCILPPSDWPVKWCSSHFWMH